MRHPEFFWPGFLLLAIGTACGALFWLAGGNGRFFFIAPLFVVVGIALLLKKEAGSLLFVGIIALSLPDVISRFEASLHGVIRVGLGLLFLISLACCAIEQFKHHRKLRKVRSAEAISSPPA